MHLLAGLAGSEVVLTWALPFPFVRRPCFFAFGVVFVGVCVFAFVVVGAGVLVLVNSPHPSMRGEAGSVRAVNVDATLLCSS